MNTSDTKKESKELCCRWCCSKKHDHIQCTDSSRCHCPCHTSDTEDDNLPEGILVTEERLGTTDTDAMSKAQKRIDDIKEQIEENLRLTSHVPYITTPDTEWEKIKTRVIEIASGELYDADSDHKNIAYFEEKVCRYLDFVLPNLRSSRDTYWMERVRDIIKMADELEHACGKDGDKGLEQWKAFKGFRNAIRDKYLTPPHTEEKEIIRED